MKKFIIGLLAMAGVMSSASNLNAMSYEDFMQQEEARMPEPAEKKYERERTEFEQVLPTVFPEQEEPMEIEEVYLEPVIKREPTPMEKKRQLFKMLATKLNVAEDPDAIRREINAFENRITLIKKAIEETQKYQSQYEPDQVPFWQGMLKEAELKVQLQKTEENLKTLKEYADAVQGYYLKRWS